MCVSRYTLRSGLGACCSPAVPCYPEAEVDPALERLPAAEGNRPGAARRPVRVAAQPLAFMYTLGVLFRTHVGDGTPDSKPVEKGLPATRGSVVGPTLISGAGIDPFWRKRLRLDGYLTCCSGAARRMMCGRRRGVCGERSQRSKRRAQCSCRFAGNGELAGRDCFSCWVNDG